MLELPGTNNLLYGMHEEMPRDVMPSGWILFLIEVGDNPEPHPGRDFSEWTDQGYGVIARLQYSWSGGGTLPKPDKLDAYVERVRTCVANSRGCGRWIIGNEPNVEAEWAEGWAYDPIYVALCYDRCWDAIHSLSDHALDEVLLPPIGPWNPGPGIPWIPYFEQMIEACAIVDGFALHTYSRGPNPASITSEAKMDSPFQEWHNGFRTYRDWLSVIPVQYRILPAYITETDQNDAWLNERNGWIPEAYREINDWNHTPGNQTIRALILYRFPRYDKYYIDGKQNVIADFQYAQTFGYTWPTDPPIEPPIEPPQEGTLIKNPSFEEGWYNQDPQGILVLPDHWTAEYLEGNDPYKRPEIKPNQEHTTDGQYSIRAFPPSHSRGFYGIYQEIETTPGQWYKFSADVRAESNPPGKLGTMVGIQPWGGSIFHRQMIWGEELVNSHDWTRVEVIAQAFGGKIRVVMGADNEYASLNNTTWWDNAWLEEWECDGGTEPPVEPPIEPPLPGDPVDYDRIAQIVEDALVDRSPVVWPTHA